MRSHAVGGAPRGIALLGERPAARAASTAAPRILYASDWSGLYQIYTVDPSGRTSTGQLTSCSYSARVTKSGGAEAAATSRPHGSGS